MKYRIHPVQCTPYINICEWSSRKKVEEWKKVDAIKSSLLKINVEKFFEMCTLMFNSIHFLTSLFAPTLFLYWRSSTQGARHKWKSTHRQRCGHRDLRKAKSKKLSLQKNCETGSFSISYLVRDNVTVFSLFFYFVVVGVVVVVWNLMMCIGPDILFPPHSLHLNKHTHTDFLEKYMIFIFCFFSLFSSFFLKKKVFVLV